MFLVCGLEMFAPGWIDLGEVWVLRSCFLGFCVGCTLGFGCGFGFFGHWSTLLLILDRSWNRNDRSWDRFQNGWNFGRNRLLSLRIGGTLGFGCGFGFLGHWSTLLLLLDWDRCWGWSRNDRNRNGCFLFGVGEELIHKELDELIARGDCSFGVLVVEERVLFGDFDDC